MAPILSSRLPLRSIFARFSPAGAGQDNL